MGELLKLKRAIELTWAQMVSEQEARSNLHSLLGDLNKKSYIQFCAGYSSFMNALGKTDKGGGEYNHWLTTQLLVMTYLEKDGSLLVDLFNTVKDSLEGTEGGETADILSKYKVEKPSRSFLVALAFRVYLDTLFIQEETK